MATDTAVQLDAERIEAFRRDGFTHIEQISPPDEIEFLRSIYLEIIESASSIKLNYRATDDNPGVIEQIFLPELQHPELLDTEYIRNGKRLAAELLGIDEATYRGVMLIYKPAGNGREASWHQDEMYWDDSPLEKFHSLSVWMPLDEVTVDSGCMQFIPGSHHGDCLPHIRPEGPDGPDPLMVDVPIPVETAVPVPLQPGGATFHHCHTLHYTGPNVSDRPRRAFTTIFDGPRSPREHAIPRPWRPDLPQG